MLIQKGGGTGPMKPWQPCRPKSKGANSHSEVSEKDERSSLWLLQN